MMSLGQVGITFMLATVGTYALRLYAPTESTGLPLLLPVGAIGIVQGISIAFDALIDPWIASISDNSKNPKGRRIPFMRMAVIPAGLLCSLVFFAPVGHLSWLNVFWVITMLFLYAICRSFYDVNFRALIPEIIPDTFRRARYYTITAVFFSIAGLLASTTPIIIASLLLVMDIMTAWRIGIIVFPVLGMLFMLLPAFFIRETDYTEPVAESEERIPLWDSLKGTLKNREFVVFMFGVMAYDFSVSIFSVSLLFIIDLLFELEQTMSTVAYAVLTVFALLLYWPILLVLKKVGKRRIMLLAMIICAVIFLLTYFHGPVSDLLGTSMISSDSMWVGLAGEGAKIGNIILTLILGFLFAYPQAAGGAVGASMFADIAQYDNMITGKNRTGMFMAVSSLISVLPSTLVPAVVGLFIYIGSTNSMPTALGVRSTMLVAITFSVAAFILYYLYNEKKVFDVIIPKAGTEEPSEP